MSGSLSLVPPTLSARVPTVTYVARLRSVKAAVSKYYRVRAYKQHELGSSG